MCPHKLASASGIHLYYMVGICLNIFAICTEYISIVLKLLFVFGLDTENPVYSGIR